MAMFKNYFVNDTDVVPAPPDPRDREMEEAMAAMEKAPRSPPLSDDLWARWEAAGPGATAPAAPAPPDPYAKQTEEMLAAMDKPSSFKPLSVDEWARWEAAGPGATAPVPPTTPRPAPAPAPAPAPRKRIDEFDLSEEEIADEAKAFGYTPEQMRAWLLQARATKTEPGPAPDITLDSFPKLGAKLAGSLTDRVASPKLEESLAGSLTNRLTSPTPIPVANASTRTDVPKAVTSTLPSTGPQTPAGKPDSSDKDGMVAPSSEGAGGDSERDLYLARLAAQNAAGFGGMGAGKNIDMGIADTLGERLKQVQALRAKREEQSLEQQRERATWGASNRALLLTQIERFKDRPEIVAALERLDAGADATKPGDFSRNVVNAIQTRPKVEGLEAGVAKTEATTDLTNARVPEVKLEGESKRALRQAQIDRLRRQTAANAVGLTRSARAVETAGKGNVPSKEAIKYIRDDIKTAEKAITPTLENFKNIERASPGFAFGKPDKSIATMDFVAAEKLPAFANKARDLRSAVEALIVDIRHGSFGASLTSSEKSSFETMLNTGLTGTVDQLSRAINMVRQKAAATAQTHFNTSMSFYPAETSQVLSSSAVFGPATRDGGVYSDVWRVQAPPTAAGGRPEKPVLAAGKTALWDVAKGKWVSAPDAQVDAAVASGKYEK